MDIVEIREFCLTLPGTDESLPFDETTLVFKVGGKIFALLSLEGELYLNLKCDPELATQLREEYPFVRPGYHMNKRHWNTIDLTTHAKPSLIKGWIEHSYMLVYNSLPKAKRELVPTSPKNHLHKK